MKTKIKSGVYFVYNADTKLTKIGCSNNIKRRFEELQKSNSHLGYEVKLELLDCIYCENYFGLEKYIHKLCKKNRKVNEWFDISKDTINTLKNNINTNDYSIDKKVDHLKDKTMMYRFENGEYVFTGYLNLEKIRDLSLSMKLNTNEKLVFYIMRDFIQYPTNCIVINDHIPTIKELEPIIGLTERSIITALKSLEDKNMLKRVQYGHKKAIYINPEYYASGKELDLDSLKLFGLVKIDDEKVKSYL